MYCRRAHALVERSYFKSVNYHDIKDKLYMHLRVVGAMFFEKGNEDMAIKVE